MKLDFPEYGIKDAEVHDCGVGLRTLHVHTPTEPPYTLVHASGERWSLAKWKRGDSTSVAVYDQTVGSFLYDRTATEVRRWPDTPVTRMLLWLEESTDMPGQKMAERLRTDFIFGGIPDAEKAVRMLKSIRSTLQKAIDFLRATAQAAGEPEPVVGAPCDPDKVAERRRQEEERRWLAEHMPMTPAECAEWQERRNKVAVLPNDPTIRLVSMLDNPTHRGVGPARGVVLAVIQELVKNCTWDTGYTLGQLFMLDQHVTAAINRLAAEAGLPVPSLRPLR